MQVYQQKKYKVPKIKKVKIYIVVERGKAEFAEKDLKSMEVIFNDKSKKFKIEVKKMKQR